jgi:hypothetical protein
MTVATAFAVSWKPLTNSKPSAMRSATPSSSQGSQVVATGPALVTSARRLATL